jgi:hypothetical protein
MMIGNVVGNVMHPRYNEHGQHHNGQHVHGQHIHDIEYGQERPRNRDHDIEDYRYIRGMNMRNSRAMYVVF